MRPLSVEMIEHQLQQLRSRFIADLQRDKHSSIESVLRAVPDSVHERLLAELLTAEIEHRLNVGQDVNPNTYIQRYPHLEALIRRLFAAPRERLALAETVLTDESQETGEDEPDQSQQVGPYRILRKIGQGGMGQVFLAVQNTPIRRQVALKIVRTDASSRQVASRFEAERHAMALMNHENVARVFDAGLTQDGQPYFVMELIHGVSITRYCDNARLSIRARLELFVQACLAIEHAHQKGIVHRDIKPSNVLVTTVDAKPVVKVIDFGLAKALHDPQILSQQSPFTKVGQVVGTLEYMSPEQADLMRTDVDGRTDVYSLGVLFFELLTGSTPLIRSRIRSRPFDEVLTLIREAEAPRPSVRVNRSGPALDDICKCRNTEARKLVQTLAGDIDRIAGKALEKELSPRYATAKDFAADVERYLTGRPVSATPSSALYRLKKLYSRRQKELLAGAIVGLVLITASISVFIQWRQTQRAEASVELQNKRILYRDSVIETQNQLTLIAMAQSSRYEEALDAAEALLQVPGVSPDSRYNVACVYSRAAEFLQTAPGSPGRHQEETLLKKSGEILLALARSGYFSDKDQVNNVINDPDIAAVRNTTEFGLVIQEISRRQL